MGRPREFDTNEALGHAMHVFWLKGYEATSMTDLMDAMHLHKGSIYKAFGDKRNLFLLSLKAYLEQGSIAARQMMETASSPKEAVSQFMNMSLRQCALGDQIKGCFMMNTVVELGPHDDQIREVIASFVSSMRDRLTELIERGQDSDEFRKDRTAGSLADYLIAVKAGLLTASKMNLPGQDPYQVAEFALAALEYRPFPSDRGSTPE